MEMMVIKGFTVLLLVVGIYGYGYFTGAGHYRDKLAEYKADVAEQVLIQEGRNIALEREVKEIKDETEIAYEQRMAALRAYYLGRMRASSGEVSGVPTPPGSIDEIPADSLPLAEQCAETTQQLVTLQEWLKRVKQAADKIAADKAGN